MGAKTYHTYSVFGKDFDYSVLLTVFKKLENGQHEELLVYVQKKRHKWAIIRKMRHQKELPTSKAEVGKHLIDN